MDNAEHTLLTAPFCPSLSVGAFSCRAHSLRNMADDVPPNPNPEPAPTPSPAPAAPPAAKTVLNGDRTEREVQLEQELETERSGRKKAETDAAYAQDELRRLKEVQSNPPPKTKKSSRWTLLHEEEA